MVALTNEIDEISTLRNQELQVALDLDSIRGLKGKAAECRQLDKKLANLSKRRAALEAVARFEIGMPVSRADSTSLGIITEKRITPGGHPEVWVSWDGKTPVPEQPTLLEPDSEAINSIVQPGDEIVIGNGHICAGQVFTVERLQARGWVMTADGSLFPPEYWSKVSADAGSPRDNAHPRLTAWESARAVPLQGVGRGEASLGVSSPEATRTSEPPPRHTPPPETSLSIGAPRVTEEPATVVATEVVEELSSDESADRLVLELRVEKAFVEAGLALQELRDRRLYRDTHPNNFVGYCRDRFGKTKQAVNYLIAAAGIYENLATTNGCRDNDSQTTTNGCRGSETQTTTNGCRVLPTNERQVRPLTKLQPEKQREVWQEAVDKAGGKVPSSKIVERIVQGLKEKPTRIAPADFCEIGDVFILVGLKEEERHYNGCWAIAVGLNSFTVEVETHQETLLVKPDNLKLIDDPQTQRMLPSTLKRIRRLRQFDLSNCAHLVLETLGHQTYLTDKEVQMLQFLEQQYGIVTHPPVMPGALAAALPNLTPGQLQEVVETAVTNGLDDNQLKALIKTAKQALNVRHHPDYFAKS